jgi:hypothetical protein
VASTIHMHLQVSKCPISIEYHLECDQHFRNAHENNLSIWMDDPANQRFVATDGTIVEFDHALVLLEIETNSKEFLLT